MLNTGDANYIKLLNKKILIEEIIKNISLSRSDLARETGLNKATVSTQISSLLDDHTVIEKSEGTLISRGRKPILLEINGMAGYSIGIDIVETSIIIIFTNFKGEPFYKLKLSVLDENFDQVINQLTKAITPFIEKYNQIYKPFGLIGIGVGIHGIINNDGKIIFTPKQQWSNIIIKEKLEDAFHTNVFIDNNANFSVLAEQAYEDHIPNLFCITLYSGIGLGIINENKIYRGYQGFAGEIGHMIINSNGLPCSCGNNGCWELYASEKSLISKLKEKYPTISLTNGIEEILKKDDAEPIIEQFLESLAIGINNIINIFNPETIILNGSIINANSPFITEIQCRLKSKINNYREIKASKLGEDSCALGGAAFVLKKYLGINNLNFTGYTLNMFKEHC